MKARAAGGAAPPRATGPSQPAAAGPALGQGPGPGGGDSAGEPVARPYLSKFGWQVQQYAGKYSMRFSFLFLPGPGPGPGPAQQPSRAD